MRFCLPNETIGYILLVEQHKYRANTYIANSPFSAYKALYYIVNSQAKIKEHKYYWSFNLLSTKRVGHISILYVYLYCL